MPFKVRNKTIGLHISKHAITAIKLAPHGYQYHTDKYVHFNFNPNQIHPALQKAKLLLNYRQEPVITSLPNKHIMTQELLLKENLKDNVTDHAF